MGGLQWRVCVRSAVARERSSSSLEVELPPPSISKIMSSAATRLHVQQAIASRSCAKHCHDASRTVRCCCGIYGGHGTDATTAYRSRPTTTSATAPAPPSTAPANPTSSGTPSPASASLASSPQSVRCLTCIYNRCEHKGAEADNKADTYTIKAIGQDDFSDIPIPDAPSAPGHAPHMSTVKSAGSAQ